MISTVDGINVTERPVVASCLSASLSSAVCDLRDAVLPKPGTASEGLFMTPPIGEGGERPAQAPAVVGAQVGYVPAGVVPAHAAGLPQLWANGEFDGFAGRNAGTEAQQHHAMRAFRGLEPWRDPA